MVIEMVHVREVDEIAAELRAAFEAAEKLPELRAELAAAQDAERDPVVVLGYPRIPWVLS